MGGGGGWLLHKYTRRLRLPFVYTIFKRKITLSYSPIENGTPHIFSVEILQEKKYCIPSPHFIFRFE